MKTVIGRSRHDDLKHSLERRRLAIQHDVQHRMRTVRGEGTAASRRIDPGGLEAATHEDIELDLIQIQAEMVDKITEAIARVDQGDYGRCRECGEDIAPKRLRALPFATRCKECQEAFETAARRDRHLAQHPVNFVAADLFHSDDR